MFFKKNPFTLSFGRKPPEFIERYELRNRVITTFTMPPITDTLFLITGVRGSGKTVLMSSIASELEKDSSWIVLRINPHHDILQAIYDELYAAIVQLHLSFSAEINLGIFKAEMNHNSLPEYSVFNLKSLLEAVSQKEMKVLITIDEVINTPQMVEFAHQFQVYTMENLPIFFLGTGLYENIADLQNEKTLTFLYRAPKIFTTPLDISAMASSYQSVFQIPTHKALKLAQLTKGYAFAFQALGYVYFEHQDAQTLDEILPIYDQILRESSYEKLWSELSDMDRLVCKAIADSPDDLVKTIRQQMNISSQKFSVYRNRLKEKGLIDTSRFGKVSFILPRFKEFITLQYELDAL